MTSILNEVQVMQNPALGAVLLWRFACGYSPESSTIGVPLPLAMIVLPLVFHARSLDEVIGTQSASGLRKFEEKFHNQADLMMAVHPRMIAMRGLSMRSLQVALRTGLLTLVPAEAVLWPRSYSAVQTEGKNISSLTKAAEKLGIWCKDLTLFEVAGILKVEF
jgi:hypothetical protein